MIALILHYLRRSWLVGVPAVVATFAFQMIASRVFQQIQEQSAGSVAPLTQFMPRWVQTAFNIGPSSMTELNGFFSICLQHPFMYTVLLSMPVALLTGWLTGDIENRSLALVLSRPVARLQVVAAAALVSLGWCALAIGSAWAGCLAGAEFTGLAGSLNTAGLARTVGNLAALIFAFAGISAAISACLSVRGDAVGWSLTAVLVMYVWNFLAQVWYSGGGLGNYSLFRYYKPTQILLQNQFAPRDVIILCAVGVAAWLVAGVAFRVRSFAV